MSLNTRTWVAVESLDAAVLPEVSPLVESPAQTFETAMVEVTDLEAKESDLLNSGADYESDLDKVSEILTVVEDSATDGDGDGISKIAVESAMGIVTSYAARWGVNVKRVAVESYETEDGKRLAKMVAVESIKDTVVEMGKKFAEWIRGLVKNGKDFLINLSNAGKTLQTRADKLLSALPSLGEMKEKTVEAKSLIGLCINSELDYNTVLAVAKKSQTTVDGLGKSCIATVNQLTNKLEVKGGTLEDIKKSIFPLITSLTFKDLGTVASEQMYKATVKNGAGSDTSNYKYSEGVALPGNNYLIRMKLLDDKKFGGKDTEVDSFAFITGEKVKVKVDTIATLNASGLKECLEALKNVGVTLESHLKDFRATNEEFGKLADNFTSAKADLKAESDMVKKSALQGRVSICRGVINSTKAIEKASTKTLGIIGKGLGTYAALSISAHAKAA